MALRPDVPYNPVASALPETQAPNDQIRVQASPQDFGAQVGSATQQLGNTAVRLGGEASDIALQQQGMINESMATDAETQYMTKLGGIVGKYKATEGLAAVSALPQVTSDIAALRQQIVGSLPSAGAQRAFNMLASRHEGFALSDANMYAAGQVKVADLASAHASTLTAANAAGSYDVAANDARFKDSLGTIDYGINRMMLNKGYGTVMTTDPTTGAATFADGPQGQDAANVYKQMKDQAYGVAWENRIHALADDPTSGNPAQAMAVFQANKDSIPAEAQAKISAYLQPKVRGAQALGTAGTVLSSADQAYTKAVEDAALKGGPGAPNMVAQLGNAIYAQESGGGANTTTSVTGAKGGMQVQPGTWADAVKAGVIPATLDINNPADNVKGGQLLVAKYAAEYGNDPARVAVAYFSGEGNVSPPGSPTPWIHDSADPTGKTTSGYVNDVLGRIGGAGGFQSKADFYRQNYSQLLDSARTQAVTTHPDDPVYQQQVVSRVEQQMSAVIRQQELSYKADSDTVYQALNGDLSKGTKPLTIDQMTAINPQVSQAWDRLQAHSPYEASVIQNRLLTQNAKNNGHDATTYGAGYLNVFQRIHAQPDDPNRVTDVSQLYPLVGQPGGLTMTGLDKARTELIGKNTPDGAAEAGLREQLFKAARQQLTGSGGLLNMKDPKGEEIMEKFMVNAYQQIDRLKAQGKTPAQIYDPSSPDYVGKIIPTLRRPMSVYMADMNAANSDGIGAPPAAPNAPAQIDLTSVDSIKRAAGDGSLVAAVKARRISYGDAAAALRRAGLAAAEEAPVTKVPTGG